MRLLTEAVAELPQTAKNLAITLEHLDDPRFAVEKDVRARRGPTAASTGIESVLRYFFAQSQAINMYDANSYLLKASVFLDRECANYADAEAVKKQTEAQKRCRAWLGPNQPGVTTPDPTAPPAAGKAREVRTGPRLPAGGLTVRRRSGRQASIVANPVLVGAVTALIVVVAVFLAYNANRGLPFVPTTQLTFRVASGANLLPGNDVREGGQRIGVVEEMRPMRLPDGATGAEVTLKLDKNAGDVPVDSTWRIRPRSVLGLKYVELTRGRARQTFADGDRIDIRQASFSNELEELHALYDRRTRIGIRRA